MADEIISLAEALARGLKRYFLGSPCIYGHICERFTASKGCVECVADYRHSDRGKKIHRAYRQANAEKLGDYIAEWRRKNPTKASELSKSWQLRNRQSQIEKRRAQAEILRKKAAEWQKKNPDKCSLYARNRRALKKTSGTHTIEEIEALLRKQNFKCASCFISIKNAGKNGRHADHIIPLSAGGTNYISNIQMLCRPCNLRKYNKDPFDWARENGKLF